MSKQVKLKFKKLIKQADFIHADLEYHDELAVDARNLFREAVEQSIKDLSDEDWLDAYRAGVARENDNIKSSWRSARGPKKEKQGKGIYKRTQRRVARLKIIQMLNYYQRKTLSHRRPTKRKP